MKPIPSTPMSDLPEPVGAELSDDPVVGHVDESVVLAVAAAQVADAKKATNVVVLDVGDVVSITGYFVVASASSSRLVRTVAEAIEEALKERFDRSPVRIEGQREQRWILVDYGDVVIHIFHDPQREFYAIERLYGDVPRIRWASDDRADSSLSSGDDDR